jgi:hypothetical protein
MTDRDRLKVEIGQRAHECYKKMETHRALVVHTLGVGYDINFSVRRSEEKCREMCAELDALWDEYDNLPGG